LATAPDPMRPFSELAGDVRDPYPMMAGLRAGSPVLQVNLEAWSLFTVTRYKHAQQVLTDSARFDRLPRLRLDPAADDPHIHGLIFRPPPELRVHFDPE
jgi:hypothetical protein